MEVKLELGYVEEELYIKNNTIIWSKGLISNVNNSNRPKTTICAYTSQYPIKHAIWCTFYDNRPVLATELQQNQIVQERKIPAICFVDTESIRIFTSENEDFLESLPFPICNLWNTKFGIFLEKQKDGIKRLVLFIKIFICLNIFS